MNRPHIPSTRRDLRRVAGAAFFIVVVAFSLLGMHQLTDSAWIQLDHAATDVAGSDRCATDPDSAEAPVRGGGSAASRAEVLDRGISDTVVCPASPGPSDTADEMRSVSMTQRPVLGVWRI